MHISSDKMGSINKEKEFAFVISMFPKPGTLTTRFGIDFTICSMSDGSGCPPVDRRISGAEN